MNRHSLGPAAGGAQGAPLCLGRFTLTQRRRRPRLPCTSRIHGAETMMPQCPRIAYYSTSTPCVFTVTVRRRAAESG